MEFVTGDDVDPVYFDSPYFVYPDGPTAVEVLRVIGAAIAKVGVVGLGRLTLSRRERWSWRSRAVPGWRCAQEPSASEQRTAKRKQTKRHPIDVSRHCSCP